ncbi:MAG: hypothetical protein U0795_04075 [Pirellulales bacterium]
MDSDRPPVILLGRGITALGALRALSRRRIPTFTACDDPLVPLSRYYRPAVTRSGRTWKCELGPVGEQILADLPFDRAVLIPCADDFTLWASQLPAQLRSRFLTSSPDTAALEVLQDKRLFADLCVELQVPHPRCYQVASLNDLDRVPFEQIERAFFKPSNSIPFLERFNCKGMWVHSRDEARQLWQMIADSNLSVLVQEYVTGGADQHFFIDGFRDRTGTVRARFARQRMRIYPPDFGNSSYCINIPVEQIAAAWDSLNRILQQTRYRGIFSAEFKRDARTGEYKILEINTRVWVFVEFAARCGVDVCSMAYQDALGLPVADAVITRPGARCANVYLDSKTITSLPAADRPGWPTVLWQWFTSHKSVLVLDDMRPFVAWLSERIQSRLGRLGKGTS